MDIYEACREVPENAKKPISGGKLKGFTDINPMWRISKLTEMFGASGFGWVVKDVEHWTETGSDGRIAAFISLNLYVKVDEMWSQPIPGIGGSMLTDIEKGSLVTSDEAFKMAYTDALSVACKALGMGADVYWANGRSKYNKTKDEPLVCVNCGNKLAPIIGNDGREILASELQQISQKRYGKTLCPDCMKKADADSKSGS